MLVARFPEADAMFSTLKSNRYSHRNVKTFMWKNQMNDERWTRRIVLRWILFVILLSIINSFASYMNETKKKTQTRLNFSLFIYLRHIEFNIEFERKQPFVTCGGCFTNWKNLCCSLHFEIFIWHLSIQQIILLMIRREMRLMQCVSHCPIGDLRSKAS